MKELKSLSDEIASLDVQVKETEDTLYQKMLCIPNVPHERVIHGENDEDNKEIRKWGEVPNLILRQRRIGISVPIWISWILIGEVR